MTTLIRSMTFLSVLVVAACAQDAPPAGDGSSAGTGASSRGVAAERLGLGTASVEARTGLGTEIPAGVGDRVLFALDSAELRPEARQTVAGWADWLRQNPSVSVTIEGHADERGTREYNLALSDRRAKVAHAYLVGLGVAEARLARVAYGKERPAALGADESAWSQNRRAVLVPQP